MPVNPNPQGKGLVPVLQGLDRHRIDRLLPPKQIDQVQMELFTSMFVLQSDFKFNPVTGKDYYLYQAQGRFKLLLVGPHEWGRPYRGRYIGKCVLHDDRTWTLSLDPAMENDGDFMAYIDGEQRRFQARLEQAQTLEDILPVFEHSFGFYGRILAFILGKSLGTSMELAGIRGLAYQEAKGLLTHDA